MLIATGRIVKFNNKTWEVEYVNEIGDVYLRRSPRGAKDNITVLVDPIRITAPSWREYLWHFITNGKLIERTEGE